MSDDDDWEFTALEEDKRTVPELVIEVGGKSYADAVLQHRVSDRDRGDRESRAESAKGVMPQEFQNVEKPTLMKVKPGRKHDAKRQNKQVKKDEKVFASILKREVPPCFDSRPENVQHVSLAEEFALSDACVALMTEVDQTSHRRMPYTQQFLNKS